MDRRQFIGASLLGAAALVSGAPLWAKPAGGRAYSELGVQLYTLRALFEQDFRRTLGRIAEIGYKDLEFAGYYAHNPSEVKAFMDANGLSSHSSHVQLNDVRNNFGQVMETASVMGQTNLIIPWLAPELRNPESYRELADLMNARGEQAKAAGFRLAYHNHDFEFENLDGTVPYDLLLERTDPAYVAMEIDLFWVHKVGVDPVSYFRKAPGRFISCHVKDATADGKMVAVGEGVIDFDAIFRHAGLAGLQRFYVEHDNPEDPVASITKSYASLMG